MVTGMQANITVTEGLYNKVSHVHLKVNLE